jgi:hypothetical protein
MKYRVCSTVAKEGEEFSIPDNAVCICIKRRTLLYNKASTWGHEISYLIPVKE